MEITSVYFGLLTVISVLIYYRVEHKFRALLLTILSGAFIATYSFNLLLYVIGYSLFNFYIGIKIHEPHNRKLYFNAGIFINILQLALFKYVSFTIGPILHVLNITYDISLISGIIIPVGLSFFTLQGIGYLINIKMGWEKPEKSFVLFFLYIAFFPRFLSGPIDRSNFFLPQLRVNQVFDEKKIIEGLRLVLFGLFKKLAIANQLALVVNDSYYSLNSYDDNSIWVTFIIQPLYLYFDFSGYTDIARGVAWTLGIRLRPNFRQPFMSVNISEFWKRFHISLGSWFQDYVFTRTLFKVRKWRLNPNFVALFLTWMLFGIWHGAGWNFMLLGLLQTIAIYYEYSTKKWRARLFSKLPDFYNRWIGRILTYFFYSISLVFFFATNTSSTLNFFLGLNFRSESLGSNIRVEEFILTMIFAICFLVFEVIKNDYCITYTKIEALWFGNTNRNRIFRWTIYFILVTFVIIFSSNGQEFLYFKF